MQELQTRLSGHLTDGRNEALKSAKVAYIKSILLEGKTPIIEAIETIDTKCYIDKSFVSEREVFWMKHYKELGQPITNSSGIDSNGNNEYRTYLSSIKKGETSWHYYLCGTTGNGVKVYNKERLIADGFSFPEEPQPERYNAWDNNKFLVKMGLQPIEARRTIVITENFPEMPQWSEEFRRGIVYDSIIDEFEDFEDPDLELGEDYEPGSDEEPEETDNDEFVEESLIYDYESSYRTPKTNGMCIVSLYPTEVYKYTPE